MKVAYLTAGAGGMFCGSCMRDNTLAAALRRQGRAVALIPLYSPIRTDEDSVAEDRVYYGGVNVYLEQKSALFRHTPRLVDQMLNMPGLLRWAMKDPGGKVTPDVGELTLSILRGEEGRQRKELDRLIDGLSEYRPDLVHLPDALFVGLAREIKRRLRRPVVCTLTGEDILLDKLGVEYKLPALELIRRRQSDVDAFIAVTRYYAGYCVENFGIPSEKVHYVPMGVKIDYESGSEKMSFVPGSDVFTIGYLARICPEKGLHLLCEAFLILRNQRRTCRLKVGGYLGSSDRPYFEAIQRRLHAAGYGDAVEYDGEVDREGKLRLLRSLDALSVPTVYREAKGLYVLEAMAQSVPVVQPRHGSFPELVEATGGGILVNPEDPADLARGIAQLMDDAALCHQLGEQAHRVVARQFTDTVMADEAWKVFEQARANYK